MDQSFPGLFANQALAVAAQVMLGRYPEASFAFAGGSIMRGQGTKGSDIDLVVVHDGVDRAWRESFMAEGFPVEVFAHDRTTLEAFMLQGVAEGRPVMLNLVGEGRIVGARVSGAHALRAWARALLAGGPAPLHGDRLETLLYQVSDLADDLRGQRNAEEVTAIAVALYPRLVDLILLGRGQWTGAGKWMPRRLRAVDEGLAAGLQAGARGPGRWHGAAGAQRGRTGTAWRAGLCGLLRVSDVAGAGGRQMEPAGP